MAPVRERPSMAEVLRGKPLIGMVHLPPLPGSPRGRQTLDEVLENIELVGRAINAPEEAAEVTDHMAGHIAEVEEAVAGEPAPRTFYEVGLFEGAIYTAGQDSFLAGLIETAGGDPITGDPLTTAIAIEDLLLADPELILLGDAAYDPSITPESVAARPGRLPVSTS